MFKASLVKHVNASVIQIESSLLGTQPPSPTPPAFQATRPESNAATTPIARRSPADWHSNTVLYYTGLRALPSVIHLQIRPGGH